LREVAESCPENYLNKYLLVSAEIARISGNDLEAMRLYRDAIQSARKNGFIQNAAIGCELAARFYRAHGFELIADSHIREACFRYAAWGAAGKVKQMERNFPEIAGCTAPAQTNDLEQLSKQLDAMTVVRASQAISTEIELNELLKRLMSIMIENAGAEKGYLILARDQSLWIEAETHESHEVTRVLPAIPVHSSTAIPQSIINYVMRTHQRVVLDDASNPNIFSTDPYIASKKAKSVLSSPIMHQNELIGIIYLENSLARGSFAPDRLAILELLSSQAAISLKNSLLYSNLKETEHALREALRIRDEFLSLASHELRTPMTSLRPHVQMLMKLLQNPKLKELPETKHFPKILKLIDREMDRMVKLIHDLLDVSRIRSGHLTIQRGDHSLSRIVRDVIIRFQTRLETAQCPVDLQIQNGIKGNIDDSAITQVVENLLSNAMKYGAGSPIEISLIEKSGKAILKVRDHGIGISKEYQNKIFDRFERGTSSEKYGGLGLGLYISRQLVLAHGGSIWVESEKGKGSTFTVEIPLSSSR
jgi:signal transduction histidine kinase